MPSQITYEEANKRFLNRTDVLLCKDGYNGWSKKSKFWDKILQEEWWTIPNNVYTKNISNPKRLNKTKNIKISFKQAQQRFIDQNRTDILLCKEDFFGWKKKSKFYDKIEKDFFWSNPCNVYKHKSVHPNRLKRKLANKKRLSFKEAEKRFSNRKDIQLCEKYYVSWTKKAKFYDKTIKKYWWATPKHICNDNSSHPERKWEKCRKTWKKKYGHENPTFSNTKRFIKETDEHIKHWLEKQKSPKPSYSFLCKHVKNKKYSLIELNEIIEEYKKNYKQKTTLEIRAEKLFNIKHFNKKPKEIIKYYKPDFKISNKLYLNVDGLYWHSEIYKNKNYHFNLRKHFEKCNLQIIQFYENEIRKNPIACKSIINKINSNKIQKININEMSIKKVDCEFANNFYKENSIEHFDLKSNFINIIVSDSKKTYAILTYSTNKTVCKIQKFCTNINVSKNNSLEILIFFLEKECKQKNIQHLKVNINLRYESDKIFITNGFKIKKDIVEYKWTNYVDVFDKKTIKQEKDFYNKKLRKIYNAGTRVLYKKIN